MLQKPIVYVSRITNLSDARYCAGMGVDLLGYVVDPAHPDYVSPGRYQEMVGWISGPGRVTEITSDKLDLKQLVSEYLPDMLHLPAAYMEHYELPDLPLMIELVFSDWPAYRDKIRQESKVTHVVMKGFSGSTAFADPLDPKVLISLDTDPGPLMAFLQKTGGHGFALKGSREVAPGLKDYEHLSRVLEELES